MPQGAEPKKNCAVARPIHVSNSHSKFGLGGDSMMDGWTDVRTNGGDQYLHRFFEKGWG